MVNLKGNLMMRNTARMAVAAVLCFTAVHAVAEPGKGTRDEQAACKPDVFRLCSEQIPVTARIVTCLKQHKHDLSPACRKVFFGD